MKYLGKKGLRVNNNEVWHEGNFNPATKADIEHVSDTMKHITPTERTNWNDANNKKHEHSNKSIIDTITQALINTWNTVTGKADKTYVDTELGKKANTNHNHVKANIIDMPTKLSQFENDPYFVTQAELGEAGYGDMMKSIYDANNNGKVDIAENADKLGGQLPNYYQKALGYTPVDKAGDTMTGTLIVDGKDLPTGTDIATMKRGSGTNRFVLETQDKAMQAFIEAGATIGLVGTITDSDFRIRTNYTDRVSIRGSDGNVGIDTTSPTQKLDVNGKIRMRTQTSSSDGDDIVTTKKYVDDKILTDVPANAKFTDTTYSEIGEAEIDTGTASTLRTITARRIKYILDKVQSWINDSGFITSSASITGNAATATKLKTSRTINGVSFDGSANITITANPNAHTHDMVNGIKLSVGTTAPFSPSLNDIWIDTT